MPVGNVAGYEGAPELSVFAADLGRAELDLVELFRGLDALEDSLDFPVFKGTDICEACGQLVEDMRNEVE